MAGIRGARFYTVIYYFVLISFIIPLTSVTISLIAVYKGDISEQVSQLRAEYILMIVQAILGIIAINIPSFLMKRYSFDVPQSILILYTVFLFCSIYLGEIKRFYSHIDLWDDILHCFSSVMTGLFGFMLVYIFNRSRDSRIAEKLSPIFLALFAFCFAVAIGAIWEIYEFSLDHLFELNMQKYRHSNGEELVGHSAVTDTMTDIIIDTAGAFLATAVGYFSIKRKQGWISDYLSGEEQTMDLKEGKEK